MTPSTLLYFIALCHFNKATSFIIPTGSSYLSNACSKSQSLLSFNLRNHVNSLRSAADSSDFPMASEDSNASSNSSNMNPITSLKREILQNSSLGDFDPSKKIPVKRQVLVGNPQLKVKKQEDMSINTILQELASIQKQGPRKYCILGTRHCSYLHQQIIELL